MYRLKKLEIIFRAACMRVNDNTMNKQYAIYEVSRR